MGGRVTHTEYSLVLVEMRPQRLPVEIRIPCHADRGAEFFKKTWRPVQWVTERQRTRGTPATQAISPAHRWLSAPARNISPPNTRLERIAQFIYTRPKCEELLRRALQPVSSSYEFIIIDCPPSLGALTETGIAAADLIIVPCQMEARVADGLVDLLEIISILKGDEFDRWAFRKLAPETPNGKGRSAATMR